MTLCIAAWADAATAATPVATTAVGAARYSKGLAPIPYRNAGDVDMTPPRLGLTTVRSSVQGVSGEQVTRVGYGSIAEQLGIQAGDVVIAVNGRGVDRHNNIRAAELDSTNQQGWVTLKIRNPRTGRTAYHTAKLFRPTGR